MQQLQLCMYGMCGMYDVHPAILEAQTLSLSLVGFGIVSLCYVGERGKTETSAVTP